jgi:hypothetical protein
MDRAALTRSWGDCYGYLLVASGHCGARSHHPRRRGRHHGFQWRPRLPGRFYRGLGKCHPAPAGDRRAEGLKPWVTAEASWPGPPPTPRRR